MDSSASRLGRILPLVVAGAGLLCAEPLGWLRGRFPVADVLLPLAGCGLLGIVSGRVHARGSLRASHAVALVAAAVALVLALGELDGRSGWMDLLSQTFILTSSMGVPVYVLLRARHAASFAVGAGLVTLASWYACWPVPILLVMAVLIARGTFGSETTSLREALSTLGAGALAMTVVEAVNFDVFALVRDMVHDDQLLGWAHVDALHSFIPRVALEVLLLVACLAHVRGRAWGIVVLAVATPLLMVMTTTTNLPTMGGGCSGWGHPLEGPGMQPIGMFEAAFALTLLPWAGPVWRALRPTR